MRNPTILVLSLALLAGCASPRTQPQQNASKPQAGAVTQDKPLFVHLLAPPHYFQATNNVPAPAHRIVTARIYPFQSFSVSVGDAEDPFTNPWDGAWTNARIDKNGAAEARPLEPIWNSGDAVLAGRIEQRDGKFFAQLQGRNRTTLNYFHGEIELEKPVYQHGGFYREAIWGVWFALSQSPDCGRFLRELDDGTLRLPLVGIDSAEAKRWEGREHGSPRSPSAEPSASPND